MAHSRFSDEYHATRTTLTNETYAGTLAKPMADLKTVLGASGPDASSQGKLDALRNVTLKRKEVDTILEGAGVGKAAPTEAEAKKIAAVKFLRHLYLQSIKGNQAVWIHSSPVKYRKFVTDEIVDSRGNLSTTRTALGRTTERFDDKLKSRMAEAMILGLSWSQKTEAVLATVKTDPQSMDKLTRWFAPDPGDIDAVVAKLSAGFKKITALLNTTQVIVTDNPVDRDNKDKKLTEAYVYTVTETPRVIYVEKAMFENYNVSVLHDMKKNWARILVHECTHLEAATDDVGGYAWAGIKPVDRVTPANAAKNADNWAFFAADCAGALVQNEIDRALGGTGGSLKKHSKNWK